VVIFHELADEEGGLMEHIGRHVILGAQPSQPFLVDEEDTINGGQPFLSV
jgi:hypothetical protein